MAKILVADDNSNVQKTVGLALAGLGIEVVAVNNGDAAVRKLPDVRPDLVLADIFMPVRNGYEVCEYVKKDSRFSRVPVVLLVGAFDPLDEREAQRVGADGILKKPFVPPDPLIAMVKTLLDRSMGDRLVAVGVSQSSVSQQASSTGIATAEHAAPAPELSEPPAEQEFQPPVERVDFGDGEHPIAFEQLLGLTTPNAAASAATTAEPVEDELVLTSARDASLGDPIFWKSEELAPEGEAEVPEATDEIATGLSAPPWKLDDPLPTPPEPEILQPVESFELVRDEPDAQLAVSPTIVEPSSLIAQDAASQASLTVQPGKVEDLAANPIEWMATVPPPVEEPVATAGAADQDAPDAAASEIQDQQSLAPVEISEPEDPEAAAIPGSTAATEGPLSFEAAEIRPVASVPDALPITVASEGDPEKTQPAMSPLPQTPEDTARSIPVQEWTELSADVDVAPASSPEETSRTVTPEPVTAAPVASAAEPPDTSVPVASAPSPNAQKAPDPALVEAVVQRVLEKMRPQVVDIITKEFLRPVVQALVHREIQKK